MNYEDPNYNIDLPVFIVHGNHDDPTRDVGSKVCSYRESFTVFPFTLRRHQSLSALDPLAAANLLNYFGKSTRVCLA